MSDYAHPTVDDEPIGLPDIVEDDGLFHHFVDGVDIAVQPTATIGRTFGMQEALADGDQNRFAILLLRAGADEDNLAKIRALNSDQYGDFLVAWSRNARVTPGESSAS